MAESRHAMSKDSSSVRRFDEFETSRSGPQVADCTIARLTAVWSTIGSVHKLAVEKH